MTGEPDSARADDDALADAILASFTSAIPVITPVPDLVDDADDDLEQSDAGHADGGRSDVEQPDGGRADDESASPVASAELDDHLGPLAPLTPAPVIPLAVDDAQAAAAQPDSSPTEAPASTAVDAGPWSGAPAPAASFTATAQLPLPPAELLDQLLSAPTTSEPALAVATGPLPPASPAAEKPAGTGLLGGFAAGDDDLETTLAARLRDLAPPDPAAAVPSHAAPAPPSGSAAPLTGEAPSPSAALFEPAVSDEVAGAVDASDSMSRDWSAAPPPAFAPPPLVEPPTWAAGFAADAADSAGAGAGQAAPDATEPSREPAAADESDPRLEPEASPEPTSAESESGAAPSAPAPVQDAVDLSAFAAPDGPPSGVITLPPEAWLAELADADRPLSLSPTPDRRSLVDPRLSAAATSDSGYSDDDDGSVDPEDRVVGSWGPTSAATAARALHPDDAPVPSWNAEVELASDAGPDAEPELPAAAAEATTAVAIAARLPRTFGIEFGTTEPAPAEQRAGRAPRLFWLAFAPTASVLLLGIGAGLVAGGASLRQAVVAVIVGAAVSALPISLAVLAGRWSGQPALVTSRAVFGVVGNAVPALLAVLTRVGWAGALLWLTADAAGGVAAAAGLGDAGLIRVVALVAGILLAGSIAVFGYGLLSGVQAAATVVGATAVVAIVALTLPRLDLSAALAVPDGSWSLVVGGAALVVAVGGLALVQSIGDLARYQRSTGAASAHSAAAVAGATLPTVILVGWGALLAASDRDLGLELTTTPIATLTGLLPAAAAIPLLVAVALSGVAGAAVATYSGGLAITAAGVRAPRPLVTVPAALVAALVAVVLLGAKVDASALLRDAAVTLAVPVAAWAGLVGGDLLLRTRRLHTPSLLRRGGIYPDVRPVAIALLVVLTALGWLLVDSSLPGLAWQGGLLPLLGPDAAAARPGVLAALVGGLLAGLLLGLGTVRRQERSVVEPGPADS